MVYVTVGRVRIVRKRRRHLGDCLLRSDMMEGGLHAFLRRTLVLVCEGLQERESLCWRAEK